jgi:hypothetical protein
VAIQHNRQFDLLDCHITGDGGNLVCFVTTYVSNTYCKNIKTTIWLQDKHFLLTAIYIIDYISVFCNNWLVTSIYIINISLGLWQISIFLKLRTLYAFALPNIFQPQPSHIYNDTFHFLGTFLSNSHPTSRANQSLSTTKRHIYCI